MSKSILKDRKLYTLFIANIFSSIGSGVTMIAIPWLLINRQGGDQIFGYVAFAVTLLLFVLSPYTGVLIDRFSRKSFLLFSEAFGLVGVLVFSVWIWIQGDYYTWQLIIIFISGSMYYSLHYPAQFAFNQEIFDVTQYKALNSLMEVQSQTSSMIAGGLASMLIEKVQLTSILFVDSLTYIFAFILMATIPYQKSFVEKHKASMLSNIKEGFTYLKKTPLLILFFISSFMPFIGVMIGNYLYPVYIATTLHAGASIFGVSDMIYAFGAVLAGLTIPVLMHKIGAFQSIVLTMLLYTIAILIIAFVPIIGLFLTLKIFVGWGNAGTRVARSTIMMERIPKHLIGRVNSFFQAIGYAFRVTLLGVFSKVIVVTGAANLLLSIGILLVFSWIGVLASSKLFINTDQSKEEMMI